jgi:hypothetical protein
MFVSDMSGKITPPHEKCTQGRMPFLAKAFAVFLFFIICAGSTYGEVRAKHWDLLLGAGMNLDGLGSKQVLVAPALSVPWGGHRLLRYGVEADLEFIDYRSQMTCVVGAAPFLRVLLQGAMPRPFIEVGAGPNLISRNHIGRKDMGGPLTFSLMTGAGLEFTIGRRPAAAMVRFRHLSNGRIYRMNESLNTTYLLFSVGLL